MPNNIKLSEELNQLIQSLKKTQINKKKTTRNKKTMKGGTGTIIAQGTFSVVTADNIECKPEWSAENSIKILNNKNDVVYKILTDYGKYAKELDAAQTIDNKFKGNYNFIYPIQGCKITPVPDNIRNLLNKHTVPKKNGEPEFNKSAETVYVLTQPNAGESLEHFKETINDDQNVIDMIYTLVDNIEELHLKKLTHYDISLLNITIKKVNNKYELFIIDFGEMIQFNGVNQKYDIEGAVDCIKILCTFFTDKKIGTVLNKNISKQIPNITKLKEFIDEIIGSRKRKRETQEIDPDSGYTTP
jgi:tRNA A-37 threonylcarbamoyl transferase component Bud32